MNVKTFIDRPIFAGVISVIILLLGIIGLTQLPVEQFPEIAPPTVSVSAAYAGANAETVQRSEALYLLDQVKGIFTSFWFKFLFLFLLIFVVLYVFIMVIRNRNKRKYRSMRRRRRF